MTTTSESRVADLGGIGTRRVRKIVFWYDTKGLLSGQADATLSWME